MRWLGLVLFPILVGCGDNAHPIGLPLEHADTLFLGAHPDDDMIFMAPELARSLEGSAATTTIYATTAGPDGVDHHLFESAKIAYGTAAGSTRWECGEITIGTIEAQHCRLRDRAVSLVDLGLPDGGIPGDRQESLLHLVDGTVAELAGDYGGSVTAETVVDDFQLVLDATTPDRIQTLELAADHGRDHSSHMFVATVGFWAAARVGYAGPITWNRGYNVEPEQPTLLGDDLRDARKILGYYEACADHCGPCGTSCTSLTESHEIWIARQYTADRVPGFAGRLAFDEECLGPDLALGDCAAAATFELDPTGALRLDAQCMTASETGALDVEPCRAAPEQYWVLDSDGSLWNGRPPERGLDMTYDHVRCLADGRAGTCGASAGARWRIMP